jgi:hypothetical protein
MGVMASIQFSDLPAQSASFCCKRGEEWPSRVFFRNAGNEDGWNAGLPIGRKRQGLLKAVQTKITQSRADKITRLTGLKSPEVKLSLPARQPPTVSWSRATPRKWVPISGGSKSNTLCPSSGINASRKTSRRTCIGFLSATPLMIMPA